MEPTGSQPDEVTQAAVDTVAEATDLAAEDTGKERLPRKRALRRVTGRLATRPGDAAADDELNGRPGRLRSIRRLGSAIGQVARRGADVTGRGVSSGSKWLSNQVLTMAPRLPVRDLATLRAQYPRHTPDELAEALIEGASRASATVGGAGGAWAVLPW